MAQRTVQVCGWYEKPAPGLYEYGDQQYYDRFGNLYSSWELSVPSSGHWAGLLPESDVCDCMLEFGLEIAPFALRFQDIVGTPSGIGFGHPTDGSTARRTMCEAFAELAMLLETSGVPCPPGEASRVFIDILRSDDNLSGGSGGVLGLSSPYFYNRYQPGEIADGMPWLALNGGMDAIPSGATSIFHGSIWINFHGGFANFAGWNLGLGLPGASQHDLLTVCRHEALHVLGFGSFLDTQSPVGNSPVNGNFHRYDTHLQLNGQAVVNNSGPYDWFINPSLTDPPFFQACGNVLEFDNANPAVSTDIYTTSQSAPSVQSAFSHLCDGGANQLLLSPQLDAGDRLDIGVEADILRALGYTLSTGDCNVTGVDDYGPACSDELFEFELCFGDSDTGNDFAEIVFSVSNLIDNDGANVDGLTGLELISSNATLVDNQDDTFTFSTDVPGVYRLRYIPVDNSCGQFGNVTNVYIAVTLCQSDCAFVSPGGVVSSVSDGFNNNPCNLICNPEFAARPAPPAGDAQIVMATGGGTVPPGIQIPGWQAATGTPDVFHFLNIPQVPFVQGINNLERAGGMANAKDNSDTPNIESLYTPLFVEAGKNYFFSVYNAAFGQDADLSTHFVLIDQTMKQQIDDVGFVALVNFIPGAFQSIHIAELDGSGIVSNPIDLSWNRSGACFKVDDDLQATGMWVYPIVENPTTTTYQIFSFFDQPELVEDNFDAGDPITIPCGQQVALGGADFCMLSDIEVKYSWYLASDITFSTPLLEYTLEREYDGTFKVNGQPASSVPQLLVAPSITTSYVLKRTYIPGPNALYPLQGFVFCNDTDEVTVTVQGGYTSNFLSSSCDFSVSFEAVETASGLDYNWNFGDGAVASGQTASHTYAAPGIYTVALSVGIQGVCQSTSFQQVEVPLGCGTPCCPPGAIELENTTVSEAVNILLSLPPNGTSQTVCIAGTLLVDEDYEFSGSLYMGPESEIIVGGNATLTLNGAELQGCNWLWRGISLTEGSSMIGENDAKIADARVGVHALEGSYIYITHTTFDRNVTGLRLEKGIKVDPFYGNLFDCSAPLKPTLFNDPDVGQYAYAGILAFDQPHIFGLAGQAANVFRNMRNGIIAKQVYLIALNNIFENLQEQVGEPYDVTGYGILHIGGPHAPLVCNVASAPLVFSGCSYGIRAIGAPVEIKYVNMEKTGRGIRVEQAVQQRIILENNILDCDFAGITLYHNSFSPKIRVRGNTIYLGSLETASKGIAIDMQEAGAPQPDADILQNEIHLYSINNGIFIQSAHNIKVRSNHIYLANPQYNLNGILLHYADGSQVLENTVEGFSTGGGTGISVFASAGLAFDCNTLHNIKTGAYFRGASAGGVMPTDFKATLFKAPLAIGLHYAPNLDMDPQLHRGNQWITTQGSFGVGARNDIYGSAPSPPQALEEMRYEVHTTTGQYYPPSFAFPNAPGITATDWFFVFPGQPAACTASGEETDVSGHDIKIARGQLYDPDYPEALVWDSQRRLYARVREYPEASWPAQVDSFYQSQRLGLIGRFDLLEQNRAAAFQSLPAQRAALEALADSMFLKAAPLVLADSLFALSGSKTWLDTRRFYLEQFTAWAAQSQSLSAQIRGERSNYFAAILSANELLSAAAVYQRNLRHVNDIYATLLKEGLSSLSAAQQDSLYAVALQCPLSGGAAVFSARSLYSLLAEEDYQENCPGVQAIALPEPGAHAEPAKAGLLRAYPNPAGSVAYIDYQLDADGILQLLDINGRLQALLPAPAAEQQARLDVSGLAPGLYWVRLVGPAGTAGIVKLAVAR